MFCFSITKSQYKTEKEKGRKRRRKKKKTAKKIFWPVISFKLHYHSTENKSSALEGSSVFENLTFYFHRLWICFTSIWVYIATSASDCRERIGLSSTTTTTTSSDSSRERGHQSQYIDCTSKYEKAKEVSFALPIYYDDYDDDGGGGTKMARKGTGVGGSGGKFDTG